MFLAQGVQFPTPTVTDTGGGIIGGFFLVVLLSGVVFAVAMGMFTAWLARERGRGAEQRLWFILGFFFGPIALLAVGLAPEKGRASLTPPGAPPDDYLRREPPPSPLAPVQHPSPMQAPPPPSYQEPMRPIHVDVDGAVLHQPTDQAYGRGRGDDGSMVYFRITGAELDDLRARLVVARPVSSFVDPADVVDIADLPAELRP